MTHYFTFYLIVQYTFLSVIISFSKSKSKQYLIVYFACFTLRYTGIWFTETLDGISLQLVETGLLFLVLFSTVVLYLFYNKLLDGVVKQNKRLYFLVPIIICALNLSLNFTVSEELVATGNLQLVFSICYFVLVSVLYLQVVFKINQTIKNRWYDSYNHLLLYVWGRIYLCIQWILVTFQVAVLILFSFFPSWKMDGTADRIIDISMFLLNPVSVLLAIALGYVILKNPVISGDYVTQNMGEDQPILGRHNFSETLVPVEMKSVSLTSDEIENIYKVLEHYFFVEQKFLTFQLTIKVVSKELKIPVNSLSYVINLKWNKNIKDLINSLRVKHAQELLKNPKYSNSTMYFIAQESGFNSESSFYTLFKKSAGVSPNVFRFQVQQQNTIN